MAATARAVDLTNVKEGGTFRPRRKPEGDYRAKIVKADDHIKEGKLPGWVLTVMVEGDARSTYAYYLNPDPKQAWKIGGICRAAGLNVKNVRIKFDPNKLVGKGIGIALEDDEYEGRLKSSIADVFPMSEVGGNADEEPDVEDEVIDDEPEEEEEPEPTPPPRKRVARRSPLPRSPRRTTKRTRRRKPRLLRPVSVASPRRPLRLRSRRTRTTRSWTWTSSTRSS
jgi:hypothetical protein